MGRRFNHPHIVGAWNADEFIADNERAAARGVARATQHYIAKLKEVLSVPGPTKSHKSGDEIKDRKTGKTIEIRASKPGEPPRKRTGALRASEKGIKADDKGLVWFAGSNQKYALALEKGYEPRNLKPRPHLEETLIRETDAMVNIMHEEMRRG